MAIKSDYISGTLTITQGSTLFTGTGTGWRSAEFKEGDTLIDITGATEYMGVIESITGEATGTLTKAWEGPSLVNVPYRMRYQPDGARSTAQARNLIEILGNGNITAFALLNGAANLLPMFTGPGAMTLITRQALVSGAAYDVQVATLADRAAYDGQDQGYAVLVSDVGDGRAAIYSKNSATSGDWSDPAFVTGPAGPLPEIEASVGTLPAGSTAVVNVTPISGGYSLDFELPEAEGFYWFSAYDPDEGYTKDSVVRHNRSAFIATQAVPVGESPSNAFPPVDNTYWDVLAAGGANGEGTVSSVEPGIGIDVDITDPTAPIVSLDAAFSDLKDVDFTTNPPEDGNVPVWDAVSGKFVPGAGGSGGGRNYDLEISQIALKLAMIDADQWAFGGGENGNGYADDLTSLDQIDVAGATNLDTSEAGCLKPAVTGTTVTIGAPAASATFNPGDNTFISRGAALPNSQTIQRIGAFLNVAGDVTLKIARENSSTSFDVVYSETFTHSGSGWQDFDLTTPYAIAASGTYRLAAYANNGVTRAIDASVGRALISGNQPVANGVTGTASTNANQFPLRASYGIAIQDMVVSSKSFLADASPSEIRLLVLVEEVDTAIIGDDYTFEVSRDGLDWEEITLDRVALDTPSRKLFWGVADAGDLAPGTTLKWRLSTTAVMVKLHDYVMSWR